MSFRRLGAAGAGGRCGGVFARSSAPGAGRALFGGRSQHRRDAAGDDRGPGHLPAAGRTVPPADRAVRRDPLLRDKEIEANVERQPYPKAGDRNPTVRVGVLDLATGATTWMKTGMKDGDDYVARVRFTPKGDRLAVIRLAREQNQADLLSCDPATGECKTTLTERRDTWVYINDDFELLSDGRVLWGSDRDGWWRLYLYDAAGKAARAVSPEGVVVAKLERVVESNGTIFFTGFRSDGLGAKDRQLYRVPLEGGESTLLSPVVEGTSGADVAADGKSWVLTHSTANAPPRATIYRADRQDRVALPFAAATAYDREALPKWEFLTVSGPGGSALPARILKPPGFDPRRRYPVLMFHYGGPESQVVEDGSSERPARELWHAREAQRGYVVIAADNPASAFFGKKGGERLHRRFGKLELEAQLAVVELVEVTAVGRCRPHRALGLVRRRRQHPLLRAREPGHLARRRRRRAGHRLAALRQHLDRALPRLPRRQRRGVSRLVSDRPRITARRCALDRARHRRRQRPSAEHDHAVARADQGRQALRAGDLPGREARLHRRRAIATSTSAWSPSSIASWPRARTVGRDTPKSERALASAPPDGYLRV